MSPTDPVHVDVSSPRRFDRVQLVLRIALMVVLGWIGITAGWLVCVLFGALPVIAAIAISTEGAETYTTAVGPKIWRVLAWLLRLAAYMSLLTDRFPTGDDDDAVSIRIAMGGKPSVGSALLRLATSIPSGIVLAVLWFASSVLWFIAAVIVLVDGKVPDGILAFQRGVLRWQTWLVAYHASLVDTYPPFALDTGVDPVDITPAASAGP